MIAHGAEATSTAAFLFDRVDGQYVARSRILAADKKETRQFRPLAIGELIPSGAFVLYRGRFEAVAATIVGRMVSVGNFWFVPLNTPARAPRTALPPRVVAAVPVLALPAPEVMPPVPRKMARPLSQVPNIGAPAGGELLARMASHLGTILRAGSPRTV